MSAVQNSRALLEVMKFSSGSDLLLAWSVVSLKCYNLHKTPEVWHALLESELEQYRVPSRIGIQKFYQRVSQPFIPKLQDGFDGLILRKFYIKQRRWESQKLNPGLPFCGNSVFLLLKDTSLFLCGGNQTPKAACLYDLEDNYSATLPRMQYSRIQCAALEYKAGIYLFGGSETCPEVLKFPAPKWRNMKKTHFDWENPESCNRNAEVYLFKSNHPIEVYHLEKEQSRVLHLKPRYEFCMTAKADADELVIASIPTAWEVQVNASTLYSFPIKNLSQAQLRRVDNKSVIAYKGVFYIASDQIWSVTINKRQIQLESFFS